MILRRPVDKRFLIISPFGPRKDPINGKPDFHKGVDFGCPVGSPVLACFDGTVTANKTKDDNNGAGNRLWLDSGTMRALYFHLDDDGFVAKPGIKVKEGQLVAFSGDTGRVTGPHLHFQFQDLTTGLFIKPEFKEDNDQTSTRLS